MSEWIDFALWNQCHEMARHGIIFEITNAVGQVILTDCRPHVEIPHDWTSDPLRFRPIPEPVPYHSDPIPPALEPQ